MKWAGSRIGRSADIEADDLVLADKVEAGATGANARRNRWLGVRGEFHGRVCSRVRVEEVTALASGCQHTIDHVFRSQASQRGVSALGMPVCHLTACDRPQ